MLHHVIFDDAVWIRCVGVGDLVAQSKVQARCLKAEGFQVKGSATVSSGTGLESLNEPRSQALAALRWLDPQLLQFTTCPPTATDRPADHLPGRRLDKARQWLNFV